MRILVRKRDNMVIYGTNDNSVSITVSESKLTIGSFVVKGYTPEDFDIIEDDSATLIDPFFSGYVQYIEGEMSLTSEYADYNSRVKSCMGTVVQEYLDKSNDESYSSEERADFLQYSQDLDAYLQSTTHVPPSYTFDTPPGEIFPWQPSCMI